ncbi:MAG: 4-hydroxybenzoate octaprenyltransferase [Symbiobacteriaceae bacterium]|jgi:4-hydroxybenzoate polyprenyltransferase|nr:4-hydroxybenzoate octaprenyltransferase [Symbiobacteriaceae bacterium]
MTGVSKVKTFAELVRFEHTILNLPFAYLGAFVAARGWPTWWQILWITVAMAGARSAAMGMNRIFDADIDAKTPRTKTRHIPAGLVAKKDAWFFVILALALLLLAAFNLNPLCIWLYPLAVLTFGIYSFTKRLTWLCHVWLGLSVAWAPLGAYIAVSGKVSWESLLLVGIITLWNAGFDTIYATQDMAADVVNGVHSIPARFGLARSLQIARVFHLGVVALVLVSGFAWGLLGGLNPLAWSLSGWLYFAGWALVAGLLHYEHAILSPKDMSRLNAAFFNMNAYISVVFFLFTAAALVVSH